MENEPFKRKDDGGQKIASILDDALNLRVRKYIEELKKGVPPQEAANHTKDNGNTVSNYVLEKIRHKNAWQK